MRAAIVLLLFLAWLQPAAAREATGSLRYACDAAVPRLELSVPEAGGDHMVAGHPAETIEVESLQTFGDPDAQGMPWRTGSTVLERRCGPYVVSISAGFYNPNPNGEMGGADSYPVVVLTEIGRDAPLGRFALGICETQNPRYGYLVPCPDDWATRILVVGPPAVRGTMLELRRTHDERRLLAPTAGPAPQPMQPF